MFPYFKLSEDVAVNSSSTGGLYCPARYAYGQITTLQAKTDFLLAAFEDFLQSYKSTATELEELEDLNLEDVNQESQDDTSDEYDMLDDIAGGKEARQQNKFRAPKRKYMDMLQQVADRKISEVCVELDDLDNVSVYETSIL